MLAIKNSKSYKILPSPPNLELIVSNQNCFINSCNLLLGLYSSQIIRCSYSYLHDFFNFFTNYNNITDNLIIFGDFNFNDINWSGILYMSSSAKFCETVFELNLTQLIDEATHIHGNILDLVLTKSLTLKKV